MKGDFSRQTFDAGNRFLRVLMQQGRVQLDADWNEQVAILLHHLQTFAADLIGPHGGPYGVDLGFAIREKIENAVLSDLRISNGRYYVAGILCENPIEVTYFTQDDYPIDKTKNPLPNTPFLVYLDVWERHVTMVEVPDLREKALGGADTATRSKLVCQVKTVGVNTGPSCSSVPWQTLLNQWQPANRGMLKARAQKPAKPETDLCSISPEARYRGAENQLYRVEIHAGGAAGTATFKWSRDNGVTVFPIKELRTNASGASPTTIVTVTHLGRDQRFGLAEGDWVEIVDDDYALLERAEKLLKVIRIDPVNLLVTLEGTPASGTGLDKNKNPFLRRWDHKAGNPAKGGLELRDGAAIIREGSGDTNWLNLEDGVQIQFQTQFQTGATYRTGDYWLIPARTITGDIEWPMQEDPADKNKLIPKAQPPHGVTHHYAPLAVVSGGGTALRIEDCQQCFEPISEPCSNFRGRASTLAGKTTPETSTEPTVKPKGKASAVQTKGKAASKTIVNGKEPSVDKP